MTKYSHQLEIKGRKGDVLIVLSGSGNSNNIVEAIKIAKKKKLTCIAIVGFDGGTAKELADIALHFEINNMQIAEDMQLVVGHICMKYLNKMIRMKSL